MNQLIFSLTSLLLIGNFSVTESENKSHETHDFNFPYAMNTPALTFEMPDALEEISGLSLSDDPALLLANNDELGKIYFIRKADGKIDRAVKFRKGGDYEGIEKAGNRTFVVKSSGTLYELEDLAADSSGFKKHKFFLQKENDVEALGYDKNNNRLLLACKGKAGEGEEYTRTKAIYAFDLQRETLVEKPVFLITLEDVCSYLGHCSLEAHVLENLHDFFNPKGEILGFSPSSIAVHPKTGHLYLTSSKGKMVLVLNKEGEILHIEKLKKSIHPQPEGLCFEADGTMWISSEAKKGNPAKLYQFTYQP